MKRLVVLLILLLSGCATIPTREALTTYNLNGTTYVALASLCDLRGINLDYDTFTRTATLTKDAHRINLMVGDTLVLVDGTPLHLKHRIDLYQGTVVAPYKFKEQVIDALFKPTYPEAKTRIALLKIKKIVIDAGHGGKDPGTIGKSGVKEKDINLDIAKRLSRILKSEGLEVIMTRSTDRFISLEERVNIANRANAELFLSIHANANRVRSINGLEVYYVSPTVDDSKRALQAAKAAPLNLESRYFAGNSLTLKTILWDMLYTSARAESVTLAQSICGAVKNSLETKILGVKAARFYVLKGARMPAILIETGFLSNPNEERMLKNAYYREKLAEGIRDGLAKQ